MFYRIRVAEPASAIEVYAAVGFRPDLVDDLEFVVSMGGSVYAAMFGAQVVGISSCLPFGDTGWVGGVAVLPEHTGRGLGRQLTERAVESLHSEGTQTVLLHATDVARPLYVRMGFVANGTFMEMKGRALPALRRQARSLRSASARDLDQATRLDREATGEDRSRLLSALWPSGATVYAGTELIGFHLPQIATGAGGVIAADVAAGRALLQVAVTGAPGELRVSFPAAHHETLTFLTDSGYKEHARVTHMYLGPRVDARRDFLISAFNLYWG